ncbi:MAG: nucleotide exchange factor GrpE [Gammaproteobacteria bacterium]|nr:MAG: nucleotide exchange factor GrpE [Gammaproteobacteria bacterium]
MVKRKHPTNGSGDGEPVAASTGAGSDAAVDEVVDDVVEDPRPATDGEQEALPAPDLESELEEARNEAASHLDDFLRARAELDNLRKRSARDIENAHKHGLERFMTELLPVKDSVELGLSAADGAEAAADKLREGLELTSKLFNAASEKFGLQEVNPEGQSFDPEYHQAMSMQEVEGVEPGTVVTVVQKGYLLHDRLLRPAMVIVAK